MVVGSGFMKRMAKEMRDFESNYDGGYFFEKVSEDDPLQYKGWILGIEGTPFEFGQFVFEI